MAKVKNRRDNHITKRPKSGAAYGQSMGTQELRYGRDAVRENEKKEGSGKNSAGRFGSGPTSGKKNRKPENMPNRTGKGKGTPSYPDGKFKSSQSINPPEQNNANIIVGRNPVTEALKSGREIEKILVTSREGSMIKILAMAKDAGIPVMYVEKAAIDRISNGQVHQGVVAYISAYDYSDMDDIFKNAESKGEEPFIIILDGLEDPHNLGAIMRTAECAGAHGIIIPKRHSCGLTETVAKSSAGAIEYMPVVKVTNIPQVIDDLKSKGIWIAACDMGGKDYYRQDMTGKIAVVIGSEGFGISKLVKEKCDFVVSMPMLGKITSLNASNAAAVIIYEVRKQREMRSL